MEFWSGYNDMGIHFQADGVGMSKFKDPEKQYNIGKHYIRRRKNEGLHPNAVNHVPFGTQFTIHFFVGVGNGKCTMAIPYTGFLSAAKMAPIVKQFGPAIRKAWPYRPMPAGGWILSQDNHKGQNAKELDSLYRRHRIARDFWPANSGDLRPIENLWPKMRRRILASDPGPYETPEEFTARVQKIILATPAADIWPSMCSMKNRLSACIANRGGRVNY